MFMQAPPKAARSGGAWFVQVAFASEWTFSAEGRSLSTDLKDSLLKAKLLSSLFCISLGPSPEYKVSGADWSFAATKSLKHTFFVDFFPPKPVIILFSVHLCCSVMVKIVLALDLEELKPKRLEVIFYIYIYVVTATDYCSPDSSSLVCFCRRISVCDTMAFACFCQFCCLSRRIWWCFGFFVAAFDLPPVSEITELCFIQLSESKIVTQCYRPISPFYSRKCHLRQSEKLEWQCVLLWRFVALFLLILIYPLAFISVFLYGLLAKCLQHLFWFWGSPPGALCPFLRLGSDLAQPDESSSWISRTYNFSLH